MTQIKITNKTDFINSFLSPIGKLTENAVLKVREKEFTATSSSSDGTLIVNCTYKQPNNVTETIYLNIPDLNRLIKVLGCVYGDDIELKFNNNNIEHRSGVMGFKFHLLEDGIIEPPAVDLNKIKSIEFPFRFTLKPDVVNQLIKASTFTTETNKIYFYTEDNCVHATLTDKQRHNIDSYSQQISDKYKGESTENPLALSFETIRIISTIRFEDLTVLVNPTLNVFLFQLNCGSANITIISSGFVG
jgi:hypothetical protein